MKPGSVNRSISNPHRLISRLISDDPVLTELYRQVVSDHLDQRLQVTEEGWPDLSARLSTVAAKVAETTAQSMDSFFQLGLLPAQTVVPDPIGRSQDPNIYEHVDPATGKSLSVRLGSVHAVKGQTHTATLLLETFTYSHHLKELIEQLSTPHDASAPPRAKKKTPYWMRSAYVAMTRPTHTICLALPEESLGDTQRVRDRRAERLQAVGWSLDFA
jgi:DNA helicase-2/ATP-dependent DNA helicase PcrA